MIWENDEGKKVPHDDNRQRSGSQKEMINLKKEAYRVTANLWVEIDGGGIPVFAAGPAARSSRSVGIFGKRAETADPVKEPWRLG